LKVPHTLILKEGRDKSIRSRHPWIFSGAVQDFPQSSNGDIAAVYSSKKEFLGYGMVSRTSQISCRMITFSDRDPIDALVSSLHGACNLRKELFDESTNAYRLVNAEADNLPGLVVDKYGDTLVIQIGTCGMERQKERIVEELKTLLQPAWIYEKSLSASRKEEGLSPCAETLFGKKKDVEILECGLKFFVRPETGQKTGFFLDQRNMRKLVRDRAKGRRVLNCFSYSGAFTIYALHGGALSADSVDVSKEALEDAASHKELNGFPKASGREIQEDVFEFLKKRDGEYDFIILDPPAFAKRKQDVPAAARGYKEINRLALKKMAKGSFFLTSSCSYHIDKKLFGQIIFSAAKDAGRDVKILSHHRLAEDHPISIYYPEGEYLKSLFCYVT
jgi:23S rRNA (cytosine1962-C5)-methyltransferase